MGVRSTGRASAIVTGSGNGPAIFMGAQEPSKSLDSTVLNGLRRGDEYIVNADANIPSAGHLFVCIDPAAGAARWQRLTSIAQLLLGPATGGFVNNTLNIPTFASHHALFGFGAGGGGASGSVQATGVAAYGGNGGDGGQYSESVLLPSDLGSATTLNVRLYPPGLGGAAVTTDTTAGVDGGSAGTGSVALGTNSATLLSLYGGTKGYAGSASAPFSFTNPGAGINWGSGGKNVAGSLTSAAAGASSTVRGGPGGSAGGCIDTSNNPRQGGGPNSGAVTAVGSNGADAQAWPAASSPYAGQGASGGGAALTGAAGAGGKGIEKGQGGGGGGAARNGQGGSGKGGDGGLSWFLMISRP